MHPIDKFVLQWLGVNPYFTTTNDEPIDFENACEQAKFKSSVSLTGQTAPMCIYSRSELRNDSENMPVAIAIIGVLYLREGTDE